MNQTVPPATDGGFARWLAGRAGEMLLNLRQEMGFGDPDALRAAGDKLSHELIVEQLARWRPGDAVLSEEGIDDPLRLIADRVWIVDPLDGTREYGEAGRTDWAVHIGLWGRTSATLVESGGAQTEMKGKLKGWGRLVAGAVALPAAHSVLATDAPPPYPPIPGPSTPGPGPSAPGAAQSPIRLAASRSRPPAFLHTLAEDLGAELVPMGSAGAKIAAVIAGDVDAYVHAGGQYEWDSAAPVAVATATGMHASRIDGATLEYNQADPRLPDLVVCRKTLAPRLLAAIARST
jgi:3'(2'), 5'-bisphosphate nucleotidase